MLRAFWIERILKRNGSSPLPNFLATFSPRRDGVEERTSDRGLEDFFTIDGEEGCVPIHS